MAASTAATAIAIGINVNNATFNAATAPVTLQIAPVRRGSFPAIESAAMAAAVKLKATSLKFLARNPISSIRGVVTFMISLPALTMLTSKLSQALTARRPAVDSIAARALLKAPMGSFISPIACFKSLASAVVKFRPPTIALTRPSKSANALSLPATSSFILSNTPVRPPNRLIASGPVSTPHLW